VKEKDIAEARELFDFGKAPFRNPAEEEVFAAAMPIFGIIFGKVLERDAELFLVKEAEQAKAIGTLCVPALVLERNGEVIR
jgi:hypothetical protein